jgi:hypothetical protein
MIVDTEKPIRNLLNLKKNKKHYATENLLQ